MAPRGVSDSQLHAMVGTAAGFLVLITVFTSFRAWDRFRRWRFELHDFLAIVSYLAASAMFCAEMYMYSNGLGVPQGQITPNRSAESAKAMFAFSFTFITAMSFALFSFSVFYLKLFIRPVYRHIIMAVLALEIANATSRYFIAFLQCKPVKKTFYPYVAGKCTDRTFAFAAANIAELLVTMVLFIIPIVTLWNVNVAPGKKAGIIFMLACGLAIAATHIVAIYTIFVSEYAPNKYSPLLNSTLTNVQVLIASLCLNMPSIYHVVQRQFPSLYRRLRLGNADDDLGHVKNVPPPIQIKWPETIGQRRINQNARDRDRSLFSDTSRISNHLRLSAPRWNLMRPAPKTV